MKNISKFLNLDIVVLIEELIKAYSGEVKLKRLWHVLPRRIKYTTFLRIIDYLSKTGKVSVDDRGYVHYLARRENVMMSTYT